MGCWMFPGGATGNQWNLEARAILQEEQQARQQELAEVVGVLSGLDPGWFWMG